MKNSIIILILAALFPIIALGEGSSHHSAQLARTTTLGVDANNHDITKIGIHDGNKIMTVFHNTSLIGNSSAPNRFGSGIYPIGSGHSYLAEFFPIVGAEVRSTTNQKIHIVTDADAETGVDQPSGGNYIWGFRPQVGYANPNDSLVAMSDDSLSWPETWPGRGPEWDGCWDGQYGKYARADQESYYHTDDYNNDEFAFYPFLRDTLEHFAEINAIADPDSSEYALLTDLMTDLTDLARDRATLEALDSRSGVRSDAICVDEDKWYAIIEQVNAHQLLLEAVSGDAVESSAGTPYQIYDGVKRGIGVEMAIRGYQWSHPAADDILILTYWIQNKTRQSYDKVAFGMYGDADVGDDGDQGDDDAWFDTMNDITYQWDHNLWSSVKGGFKPVYFGWKYLESPGNPLDGRDNDEDGMIDESQFDGIDNDGDWLAYTDDLGTDGIGPNFGEYVGPDADGTEGNGLPDPGEPNFEYTDNDESDQIGLTSFMADAWPAIASNDDESVWSMVAPGNFAQIKQTVDIVFMYASAYFGLPPSAERKFAVSLVFGSDLEDILRNAQAMQEIYNSDYNFAKPPNKPRLTAVPGDGAVTLYWDDLAEYSEDPIYGRDFEGYRIYRATDPAFSECWTVTDAYGHPIYNQPIAQFDLVNDLYGPHPIDLNGAMFNMGNNTGLTHSWTDTTVTNGQTYYYAIVSYDKGYDYDFYERGLTEKENLHPITPSECNMKITTSASGEVVDYDINTVRVVPNAPAMGYLRPDIAVDTLTSASSGEMEVQVVDPSAIQNGDAYEVTFKDWSNDLIDNDGDWQTWTDDTTIIEISGTLNLLIPPNSDTLVFNLNETTVTGLEENTTRFLYFGYWWETTFVDSETVVTPDSTYINWFVEIPDTAFVLDPTLGLWDGWEELYDDLGEDGCNDAYETGDPENPCSDIALDLGGDPNGDNWHPVFNPNGTQANGRPNTGEPHLDMADIDEVIRNTSSFTLTNLNSGETLLRDHTDFSGDGRGLVTEGFKLILRNDEIGLLESQSGWTRSGINMEAEFSLVQAFSFEAVATPFDYVLTIQEEVADTSINFKPACFDLYDNTNEQYVDMIYMPTNNDTILRHNAKVYPVLSGAVEDRISWQFYFKTRASNISSIVEWRDKVLCATGGNGIAVYSDGNWVTLDEDEGLLSSYIRTLTFDRSGRLMVGSAGGLNVHTDDGWVGFAVDLAAGSITAEAEEVNYLPFDRIYEDEDGWLWSVSNNGVLKWDWKRTSRAQILRPGSIATWLDFETGEYGSDTLAHDSGLLQRAASDVCGLEDGTVVVSSQSEGLQFYHRETDSWTYITEDNSAIPSNTILCLEEHGDELWVGTKRGLGVFRLADSTFTYIMGRDSLPTRKVNDIQFGTQNRVYIATPSGMSIMTLGTADTTYQNMDADDVPEFVTNKIATVVELSDGSIWAGSELSTAAYIDGEWEDWAPEPGDQCILRTTKPFSALDTLTFTAAGAALKDDLPESMLMEVAVVPNPYVVTASWEPEHLYATGRGQRKIDFINLPPECTIKIFTLSGKFVDALEHNSEVWNGAESWDLLSRDGLDIAYGLYIYHLDAPGIGEHIGKFAVIK